MSNKYLWPLSVVAVVLLIGVYQVCRTPVTPTVTISSTATQVVTRISPPVPRTNQVGKVDERVDQQVQVKDELSKLNISPAVKIMIGLSGDAADSDARMNAMKKLTRQLSDDDIKALRLFLDFRLADQKGMEPLTFNAMKNDAVDVMLRQDKFVDGLGGQLAAMFADKKQDDIWRDYCIQYLGIYYRQKWPTGGQESTGGGESAQSERKAIADAYWAAMEETDKSAAGTSLLNLEVLSRTYPEFDRQKLADKALAIAADRGCLEAVRVTAIRVCGMMKKAEALPAAREIAQTGESIMLRMAAIATIGELGGEHDVELVQSLANDPEKRIKAIAETALKNLKDRVAPKG